MPESLKPCPVKNCQRTAKREHLMCPVHWKRVPRITQRAVWDRAARITGPRPTVDDVRTYREAANDAIKAVEAKEAAGL